MKLATVIGLVVLLLLTAAACDRGASFQDAIARAIAKMGEARSYRSAGNSTSHADGVTTVSSYELEYAAPDRYHSVGTFTGDGVGNVTTTTSVDYGNFTVTITETATSGWTETIAIGDKGYMRSSDEPQWQVCEVYTPDSQPRPGPTSGTVACQVSTITWDKELELLNYFVELEKLPDEEIDGVNCSHYSGRLDQDSYLDMLRKTDEEDYAQIPPEYLELMRRQEIFMELWIDGDDYIRQQRSEFRFPTSEEKWVTGFSTNRYFDFNEPISIEPPEIE